MLGPFSSTFVDPLIALALGLLVGLQKERVISPLAGLKTFGLASLLGAVTGMLASRTDGWILAAGLLAIVGVLAIGNAIQIHNRQATPGQTTEVAMLVMYAIGALAVLGPTSVAVVLGGAVAMLLHLREELKGLVMRMSDQDVRAIMQFVLVWLVILPILPNRTFGPFDVLNPHHIWLMVVLIVGLNLAGYAAFRALRARSGTAVVGILGGVVSSTATTFAYARAARIDRPHAGTAALVIWIASAILYVRVLVEIGAVAPGFLRVASGPVLIMLGIFVLMAAITWRSSVTAAGSEIEPTNPTHLRMAIIFAAIYGAVLLAVAAAEAHLGDSGLYATAVLSSLSGIDAITLSASRLVSADRLDPSIGWRLIVVASLSNMVFKLVVASVLGGMDLARRLGALTAVAVAGGAALMIFWP